MKRAIILVGLMCATACGSSSGSAEDGPTEGTATATGRAGDWNVSVRSAVVTHSYESDALLFLTSSAQACTDAQANRQRARMSQFSFELKNAKGGLVEGTYVVGRTESSGLTAEVEYLVLDRDCSFSVDPAQATSGTVTLTAADMSPGGLVEGTFNLSFGDGRVSGTFSAQPCEIPLVWDPPACL